jgi:hypothetical protein
MTKKLAEPEAPDLDADKIFLGALKSLQAEYDKAAANWKRAKDRATALKKEADDCAENLFEYVRKLGEPLPMFEGGENNGEES